MGPRVARAVAVAATVVAALASPAVAAAPVQGVFVPGETLGGIRLGLTKAEVRARWGSRYGVCRNCAHTTWYFNLKPFQPQGAGVEFRGGRVARVFTVWRPLGWRTTDGIALGVRSDELPLVRSTEPRSCDGYSAYVLRDRRATSIFYLFRGRLWGFALMRRGLSPCL
jgi:opacity protein-like surface antigen